MRVVFLLFLFSFCCVYSSNSGLSAAVKRKFRKEWSPGSFDRFWKINRFFAAQRKRYPEDQRSIIDREYNNALRPVNFSSYVLSVTNLQKKVTKILKVKQEVAAPVIKVEDEGEAVSVVVQVAAQAVKVEGEPAGSAAFANGRPKKKKSRCCNEKVEQYSFDDLCVGDDSGLQSEAGGFGNRAQHNDWLLDAEDASFVKLVGNILF